jgi:alpha-galactosidase
MTNPTVQDFVFSIVDDLLTKHPEIAYIKWDANASIQNCGSTYLPRDKQSNLYVDYHFCLVKTLERIRAKYPNVVIQNCASGGGRANYGLMPYFDEFWVSDNNDALQRVYIQWGTSYFFPSNAMAQHIGGSPYLMTGRTTPIKFRCDVAMSGRLGMELQPAHMTDEERAQCTVAFADYKELRELIQLGNLYRLVSPYEPVPVVEKQQVASLMYVNDAKDHAVLFAYGLSSFMKQSSRRIRLSGLDPDRTYTLHEKNIRVAYHHDRNAWGEGEPCELDGKSFTGAYLMSVGLNIPLFTEYNIDYPSRIFELK